ncbi:MAG TPA: gluconate 2-dehydrogenase subunit 3 family protein [Acidobacteriaceae bacterium]|nr:gluconate 2-dehydrogenase subunit 3 family protein [Acidobacteriaceae bacterium]
MKGMEDRGVTQARTLRFQRRAMLKMMMALPIAGLMPLSSLAAEVARTAQDASILPDGTAWKLRVLTAHEWATVGVLSDWILPADEVSGSATDAGVPEFIDDWLDFQRGDLLVEIREGLAWLDGECQGRFRRNFVDCSSMQQQQILDRIAWPDKAAPQDAKGVAFFNQFRDLTLSGFYTSEVGIRDLPYVGNEPQAEWRGCPTDVLAKLGI